MCEAVEVDHEERRRQTCALCCSTCNVGIRRERVVDLDALPQGSDSDDDDDDIVDENTQSYKWLAQQTTVNSNCLYSAVSYAITGMHILLK